MAHIDHESRTVAVKIALVGQPASGKAEILREIASQLGGVAVTEGSLPGAKIYRAEIPWDESLGNGYRLIIKAYTLSGEPTFGSATQFVMNDADAFLFVADYGTENPKEAREQMQSLVDAARRNNQDLAAMPFFLQYHFFERNPALPPERMDEAIGIPPGSLPRYCTCANSTEAPASGPFFAIVAETARRLEQEPVAS